MTHTEPDPVPLRPRASATAPTPAATTLRGPEDLLAVVPVVFGFVPSDSLVMLTVGAQRDFHARLDLQPPPGGSVRQTMVESVDLLLRHASRYRARQLLFVVYTDNPWTARLWAEHVETVFEQAGHAVLHVLRATGDRWWPLCGHGRVLAPSAGHRFDLRSHPMLAEAVLRGDVVLGSRAELAASLEPVPALAERVAALLEPAPPAQPPRMPVRWQAEAPLQLMVGWVEDLVARCVGDQPLADPERDWRPSDDEVAELLVALHWPVVRDAGLSGLDRSSARGHVRLWIEVLRRTPQPWAAEPATLLAVAAWQAGNGALAWCAVDRARSVDPEHRMAGLVAHLLEHAVPPPREGVLPRLGELFDDVPDGPVDGAVGGAEDGAPEGTRRPQPDQASQSSA